MICSSLNLLRFIRPSPGETDSTENWEHFRGARQTKSLYAHYPKSPEENQETPKACSGRDKKALCSEILSQD
jgi:hypothetical protein